MNKKKLGGQTVRLDRPVTIRATASTVGTKEGEGPLKDYFDVVLKDGMCGQKSWEQAESIIAKDNMSLAVQKSGLVFADMDYVLAGDLLNQSIGTTFGILEFNIPFFGLFGACSTFGEGMGLGAMLIDGGYAEHVLVGASSHFCSAEKQFRFPLELGGQRPPTASWTVTGDGAAVLSRDGEGPFVSHITTGKIVDMGVKDANNMGAVMSPAAADTVISHFKDTGRGPDFYDIIVTGDLGHIGHDLFLQLMKEEGYNLALNSTDCGKLIFDKDTQDTHAGGSGCACAATTFSGYFYPKLKSGEIKNMLFIPTGSLQSPTSVQQGQNIPGIAHALALCAAL